MKNDGALKYTETTPKHSSKMEMENNVTRNDYASKQNELMPTRTNLVTALRQSEEETMNGSDLAAFVQKLLALSEYLEKKSRDD